MKSSGSVRVAVAVAAAAALFAIPALAASPVETYAQSTIDQGVLLLQDKSMNAEARSAELRNFLGSTLDLKRIALFTLGDAGKSAAQASLDAYEKAFEDFTLTTYVGRVGGYGGQTLKVSQVTERAPGDFIVEVSVWDPSDPPGTPPGAALFRVLAEPGGGFAVVDASVQGVWLEVAEREDIQGYLEQNGEDIAKLTDHLNTLTAAMKK
jgi:ABC-type transporter MlaC component